jgi:uncharacterized protein YegL
MSQQVLPFYLICDESGSMELEIELMNAELLVELHSAIATDPVVADKTRFAIMGLAEDSRMLLELTDLSDVDSIPGLTARGQTNFGDAFRLLKATIEKDVNALKAAGDSVYRPTVFFLSDGQPTDTDWMQHLNAVTDPNWKFRPNIIAFGIGDADADTIRAIGTFKAFILNDKGMSPAKALTEFAKALTRSIVRSGTSAKSTSDGSLQLEVADTVPGFTSLKVDTL